MASLGKERFYDLCNSFPDILIKMKEYQLSRYKDEWKMFKISLLQHVDYFNKIYLKDYLDQDFYDEVQYHMTEAFYEQGTQIIGQGESCTMLYFVFQGSVELLVHDKFGDKYTL